MPYSIVQREGRYYVENHDKGWIRPEGGYKTRKQAKRYLAALEVNAGSKEDKEKRLVTLGDDGELVEVDSRYYEEDYAVGSYGGVAKVGPQDERAMYDPLGGTGTEACANCNWFDPEAAKCDLVWGDIVATGLCKLWLAQYHYTPEPIPVTIVKSEKPKTNIWQWVKDTFFRGEQPPESGFKALDNGSWVAYFTNNFKDKRKQILTQAAHEQYVDWFDRGLVPPPVLWYWHIPGTDHGQAEWMAMEENIMIAAGHFDGPYAAAFQKEYQTNPHTVSHTFVRPINGLDADGHIDAYVTLEISPLPAGREANPYTLMEVMEMAVSKEKQDALARILGSQSEADKAIAKGREASEVLQKLGIQSAEVAQQEVAKASQDTDARTAIAALAEMSADRNATVDKAITTIAAAVKQLLDGEQARDKKVDTLSTAVNAAFGLQPRASAAAATQLQAAPEGQTQDPLLAQLALLQQNQLGEEEPKDVITQMAAAMAGSLKKA
jgi:hypothetical protein